MNPIVPNINLINYSLYGIIYLDMSADNDYIQIIDEGGQTRTDYRLYKEAQRCERCDGKLDAGGIHGRLDNTAGYKGKV